MPRKPEKELPVRNLVLVAGDQLWLESTAFDGFDPAQDAAVMMEVAEEATYISQHKIRLVLFFSAMRHFRDALRERGWRVYYREIDQEGNTGAFASEIEYWTKTLSPRSLVVLHPGDYRVLSGMQETAGKLGLPLEVREDRSYYCSSSEFASLSEGPGKLILENFYHAMRRKHDILMEHGKPLGGRWNYDSENRKPLSAAAKGELQPLRAAARDATTEKVMAVVAKRFADSPGELSEFDYPVTRAQALDALQDFVQQRLDSFGPFQDAMSSGEPYLFHSRLSSSLNLHLLSPREVVDAAILAYRRKEASLSSVEGFVRQILGWREFVRGIYWKHMPDYAGMNALDATLPVPRFFWTAETEMNCLRNAAQGLVDHAYAHHIHRLMVFGLYSLLLGVHPYRYHEWHMSMFVDAIDWVSLPNTLGMSQFGDGGVMGTKPYCASGNYIHRMSDYCKGCRYTPAKALGKDACPFTTLYWDFLARHRERLETNPRMRYQLLNLDRRGKEDLVQIRRKADKIKESSAEAKEQSGLFDA